MIMNDKSNRLGRKRSLAEAAQEWKTLLESTPSSSRVDSSNHVNDKTSDPFDCSDLFIDTLPGQIDTIANNAAHEWERLERRRIKDSTELPCWYRQHVRLPPGFDYKSTTQPLVSESSNDSRVLQLDDPSKTASYEQELWNIFASVPTSDKITLDSLQDAQIPHTKALYEDCVTRSREYPSLDAHGLSRFRMSDRHDYDNQFSDGDNNNNNNDRVATAVFEFWKGQPKRQPSPDARRMVAEFKGTQTLYDIHCLISEMTRDELWCQHHQQQGADDKNINDDGSSGDNHNNKNNNSGMFFIEDTFYTAGSVDYSEPIINWLHQGTSKRQSRLHKQFGLDIDQTTFPIKSMQETCIADVAMRFGVRYMHVYHGNVECSVYLTDHRYSAVANEITNHYPLLHDIWTTNYGTPVCEACQHRFSTFVTTDECTITHGSQFMCAPCCKQLDISADQVYLYNLWKSHTGDTFPNDNSRIQPGTKTKRS